MTEKRFVPIGVEWTDGFIQDHISDRDLFNIGAVCNLLNDLSEENGQLKKDIEYYRDTYSVQEYGLDIETHIQLSSSVPSRKELLKENEQLKAQLYCDSNEGVCSICKHHYLENGSLYYISKCEKGHEKCSKESVRHCEDFEVKELEND